jgi:hypothetical protein
MVGTAYASDLQVVTVDFESGTAEGFKPHDQSSWEVINEGGNRVYCLKTPGGQTSTIRKPGAYSILEEPSFSSFTLTARVKCLRDPSVKGRDVLIFFGYQDDTHYYYAHLSNTNDLVHNRILIVNGADRAPIGPSVTIPKLMGEGYYSLRLRRHLESGLIEVYLGDSDWPVMTAVDKTFGSGKIGFGSFDDTACFDDIRVVGLP